MATDEQRASRSSSRGPAGLATGLRFEVLGPVRAWRGDVELDLGSPQQRTVLAVLLLSGDRHVARDTMVDALWGDDPPRAAHGTIRTYISRLRQGLGPSAGHQATGLLASFGDGYAFRTSAVTVDLELFTRQAQQARLARRRGDAAAAASQLSLALALWRGTPLAGLRGPYADAQRARLLELRLAATEERLALDIESGGHLAVIGEVTALLEANPLREKLSELLMLALYQAGRQADALAVYGGTRRLLHDEIGIEPGPGLRRMQERILQADDSLGAGAAALPAAGPPAQLPPRPPDFTGQARTLAELTSVLTGSGAAPVIAIMGMPGAGKTALALQAAHAVRARFPDGQLYAGLGDGAGGSADPEQVLAGFHEALGSTFRPGEAGPALRARLAGRRLLVVLDGAGSAVQVRRLLAAVPGCAVIITAQQRLIGLPGVRWIEARPLPPGEGMSLLERLVGPARIAAERADAEQVVAACAGQPIALRVAAARLIARPAWGIAAMARQLAEELSQPVHSHADCELVEAPFEAAYRRLRGDQAFAFRQAAMSDGQDVGAAAVSALMAIPEHQAFATLDAVADTGLIQAGALGQYRYNPLVKLFAWRKAVAQDGLRTCEASRELLRRVSGRAPAGRPAA